MRVRVTTADPTLTFVTAASLERITVAEFVSSNLKFETVPSLLEQ